MLRNRSTVYTVVRERGQFMEPLIGPKYMDWEFDGLVGTYVSLERAEEIAGATIQRYIDAGMSKTEPEYRCTVKPSTFYDE